MGDKKSSNAAIPWLPPRYEWDFRSVTPKLCRLACLWEYARSDKTIASDPEGWHIGRNGKKGKGANTILGHYLLCDLGVFDPWAKIHDLRFTLFAASDLKNLSSFASKLRHRAGPLDHFLWRRLSPLTREQLISPLVEDNHNRQLVSQRLADELNRIIRGKCIYTLARFAGIQLETTTSSLLIRASNGVEDIIRLNRMLLEDAYPLEIVRGRAWQPQHWRKFDVWSSNDAIQVRSLREVKNKIEREIATGENLTAVLDRHLDPLDYLFCINIFYGQTADILKEFKLWLREERKKFSNRPKGRNASPPFDRLKWLSAYRLENARKLSKGSFSDLQDFLRQEHKGDSSRAPTLPIYASQGAWSKAVSDAAKCLRQLERSPKQFEFEILF